MFSSALLRHPWTASICKWFLVHHSVIVSLPLVPCHALIPQANLCSPPHRMLAVQMALVRPIKDLGVAKIPFVFFGYCGVCGLYFACLLLPLLHICVVLSHLPVRTRRRSKKCGGRQSQDEMVGIFRAKCHFSLVLSIVKKRKVRLVEVWIC